MITKIFIYNAQGTNPHENLAAEKVLMDAMQPGEAMLYLWQNLNTVVIGKNQNAWLECRTSLLEEEGGKLSRRLSGGGAVYHDMGNLNFTFLVNEEDYALDRQLSVIQTACKALGLNAERSGRNDVLVDGRKFSGNAFYHSKGKAYHHGTLLISVDGNKLSRYLSPSKAKLQAKGVESVRSRVVNLAELVPGLTCEQMHSEMTAAFGQVYGLDAEQIAPDTLDWDYIESLRARNASRDWLYGPRLPLSFECEERFDWGSVQLQMQVESGVVVQAKVYSDAMDWGFAPALERTLTGSEFSQSTLCARIRSGLGQYAGDLCAMLDRQEI